MKTLEARFRVVTPMFLGGADQKAELVRSSAIKGALRFWWRARHWSRHLEMANHQEVAALRALHDEEARLFGIAAEDQGGGQGVFLLQVANPAIAIAAQPFAPMESGHLYLLGQGLASFEGGNTCRRNAIKQGGEFTVKLIFRPATSESDIRQVADTLLLFGLIGSLGSRARHGLGSVAITSGFRLTQAPQSLEDYKRLVTSLLPPTTPGPEAPFTAFGPDSRIDISDRNKDVFQLLNSVGVQQQLYRSYGRGKMVGKLPAERNFVDDHDLILGATGGATVDRPPRRSVFGLPHNYFFSSTKAKADVNYVPDGKEGRRASPLFLHLHPIGDDFIAVHILLPARFLPEGARIRVKSGPKKFQVEASPDWGVLRTYLNRFEGEVIHGSK